MQLQPSDSPAERYEGKDRKYWGFYFLWWSAITVLLAIGSVALMSEGATGAAFGGLAFTALSALYARYLHNWGRWRMIFIIF